MTLSRSILLLTAAGMLVAGCTTSKQYFQKNELAYLKAQNMPAMEVPPDMKHVGAIKPMYPIPKVASDVEPGTVSLEPPEFKEPS